MCNVWMICRWWKNSHLSSWQRAHTSNVRMLWAQLVLEFSTHCCLALPGWESSLSDGLLCLIWAVGHLCSQIWSDLPSKDRSLRSIRHHLLLITDSLDVDSGHLGDFSCFETNRPPQCGHDSQKHHCRAKNRPYNNCDFVKMVPIFFKCVSSRFFALILAESFRLQLSR